MSATHTPGNHRAVTGTSYLFPDAGRTIELVVADQGQLVTAVVLADCDRLKDQAKANAQLYAAAPELLEALEDSNVWLLHMLEIEPSEPECARLRLAIAANSAAILKARGH